MTFVTLHHLHDCGDVEALILFCDLISRGPNKPYHAEFLLKKLFQKVAFWPVYLGTSEIRKMISRSYYKALNKHSKLNPGGPLPNSIRYFPHYNTIEYRPNMFGVIITLDLTSSVLLIQGHDHKNVLNYGEKMGMLPPFRIDVDRRIFPSEICNFQVSLGEVVRLMQ
jgi:hypothetical protein